MHKERKDKSEAKRLMEMQQQELEAHLSEEVGEIPKSTKRHIPANARSEANAKIAAMFEEVAEYEADIKEYEVILALLETIPLMQLAIEIAKLTSSSEDEAQDEILSILTHALKKELTLKAIVEAYDESELKHHLAHHYTALIKIKESYIKEEFNDMKIRGLKPDYVRKVYKNYHGIE